MKRIIFILFIIAILFTSCASPPPSTTNGGLYPITNTYLENGVVRFIDKEAGVVCWTVFSNGISCLPIGETTIR